MTTASGFSDCGALYAVMRGVQRAVKVSDTLGSNVNCSPVISSDGRHFAYMALRARVGDTATPATTHELAVSYGAVLGFSPDGRYLALIDNSPSPHVVLADVDHVDAPLLELPHAAASPYDAMPLSFDQSSRRVLARYADGWDQGYAVWPIDAPQTPQRVAPAGWTVGSAIWSE